ncbi:MAG: hypothetical protein N2544_18065, partial [Burkholderiales bacterium]|nr:hypothetical protein [Burkholderiales bacterium]
LFSGAEFGRLLAWSEEYSELLKLAEEKGGRYIKKAERMFEKLAEEMERELYIGKDVVPDIEEDLQEPQAYLLPGMISQKKNLPGNVPFKPGDAGVADPVVSETRDALSNSEILRDTVTASILANRLFVARDKVIRIRKGDRRYYEEWLRRQSQRADDAELLRRMNDPSLTSIERLRLAVIRESELANIARELDILNRRL